MTAAAVTAASAVNVSAGAGFTAIGFTVFFKSAISRNFDRILCGLSEPFGEGVCKLLCQFRCVQVIFNKAFIQT